MLQCINESYEILLSKKQQSQWEKWIMKSMTGYASVETQFIRYDIKGVNHRFLDIRIHTPSELMKWEKDIRTQVMEFVKRGSLDIFIQLKSCQASNKLSFDTTRARQFLDISKKLSQDLNIPWEPPHLDMIFNHGRVLQDSPDLNESLLKDSNVFEGLQEALIVFDKTRKREGEALKTEIDLLLEGLEKTRLSLEQLTEKIHETMKEKWDKKVSTWKAEIDPIRLAQEVLFHMDKSDICEELVRLKEHIKACGALLKSPHSEGKKLDFYSQELFREMTTIGAKSSLADLTQKVIQGKSIIEKIRQQVQNIE